MSLRSNSISLCILTLLIIVNQSCKKDVSTGGGTPSPVASAPVLAKMFFIDTTLAAPKDTIVKYLFTYDSQNRPSFITYIQFTKVGDTLEFTTFKYNYNGADTFAYQVIQNDKDFGFSPVPTTSLDTNFLTFENNQLVYDSTIFVGQGFSVNKFSYNANDIKVQRSGFQGVQYTGFNNVYQTKSNGNITHQIDTTSIITPYGSQSQRFEINITYLSNPDPLYKIILPQNQGILYNDVGIPKFVTALKNLPSHESANLITWGGSIGGYTDHQVSYSYTFRPDGYPSEGREILSYNGVPGLWAKLLYQYK